MQSFFFLDQSFTFVSNLLSTIPNMQSRFETKIFEKWKNIPFFLFDSHCDIGFNFD